MIFRLTQEISELQIHLSKLNTKLSEAENAMKMLKNTKRELKDDLNVKALSLVIDRYVWQGHNIEYQSNFFLFCSGRQKCMAIRLNFPYHTRCVCSTLKEDEAQVRLAVSSQPIKLCKLYFSLRTWPSLAMMVRKILMKRQQKSKSRGREGIEDQE